MRKLLPIALLLLYAGITLADTPAAPVSLVIAPVSITVLRDTTTYIRDTIITPDTTLLPITALQPVPVNHSTIGPSGRHSIPPTPVAAPAHLILRLSNPSPTLAITHIALEWELQVNGASRQKGTTGNLTIAPGRATLLRLPVRWPGGDSNEVYLQLRYRRLILPTGPVGSAHAPIKPGPVLGEEQLLVQAPATRPLEVRQDGELTFTDVNDTFTIQSPLVHIEFNKQTGWLQRYAANGGAVLTDTPLLKAYFWPPSSDTTTPWQEASREPHLQLFATSTGATMIIVRTEYTLPPTPCLLHVSYTINSKGEMLVAQQVEADSTQKGLPLPCFGMRWLLPADFDSIEYYGPGGTGDPGSESDSTSADTTIGKYTSLRDSVRLHAPWVGIYPYIVGAQTVSPDNRQRNLATATGLITAVRWIRISGPGGSGLLITADSALLNVRALQSTPVVLLRIDSRQPAATGIPGDNRQLSYGLPYGNYPFTYKVSPVTSHHTAISGHP